MATGLGIDIGTEWIKAVQVQCSGGKVTVTGALKLSRRDGPAAEDEDGATHAIPPTLGQELKQAKLRRSGVLGLTGREVVLRYVTAPPMPPDKLKMFIDMQVADRLTSARKDEGPPPLTYDFRILNVPIGLKGDLVIMAGLAKNEYLYGLFAAAKGAGVRVTRAIPSAFGLAQAYLRTHTVTPEETVALVEVGHEVLEVALLHEDALYFARSGPGGGRKFDQALAKLLGLPPQRVKEFKHQRARILPEGARPAAPQDQQFQAALREGAEGIANAIRASVTFCRTQAKLPKLDYQRIILSGGGARLQGLAEYLEKKTQRPVQVLDLGSSLDLRKLDAESAKCFEGEVPDMAVALGLAILDADPRAFCLDLTPPAIVRRRALWGKTVFAAAAGVALLAGLWIPYQNAEESRRLAAVKRDELEDRVRKATGMQKSFEESLKKIEKLTLEREYYARQARLGNVYLELFTRLREQSPKGLTYTYLGPKGEGGALDTANLDSPARELLVRGYYDPAEIPDVLRVLEELFGKLKAIRGLDGTPRYDATEKGDVPGRPECKTFAFEVTLADPSKPLEAPKAEPAAAAPAAKAGNP